MQIAQPLTLEGVVSGTGDQVIIAAPSGGLTSTTSGVYSAPLYPQVWVTAGPVNLTDITVDGTGVTCPASPATYLAGVFYASNSSGVINHVTTRYQQDNSDYCGTGIWAENTGGTTQNVTIENSSIHDFYSPGIFLDGNLKVTVSGNYVSGFQGIFLGPDGTLTGTVENNSLVGNAGVPGLSSQSGYGVQTASPGVAISHNTLASNYTAISVVSQNASPLSGPSITLNQINGAFEGITLLDATASVGSNTIQQSTHAINLCYGQTSTAKNTINDAVIGMYNPVSVPFTGGSYL